MLPEMLTSLSLFPESRRKRGMGRMLGRKRTLSPLTVPLIFVFSLLLTLVPAYACYDDMAEADFLSAGLKFEAEDADISLLEKQPHGIAAAIPWVAFHPPAGSGSARDSFFSVPLGLNDPAPSILRC